MSLSCGTFYLHPRLSLIDPDIQFTQLYPEILPSGEHTLAIEYGLRSFGILRVVSEDNFRQVLRQAYEVSVSSPFELLQDDQSVFHDKTGQSASSELVAGWIRTCESEHNSDCNGSWRQIDDQSAGPFIVVDVEHRCLVQMSIAESRYFALSYVWGDSVLERTVKANLKDRQMRMALPSKLPTTIEDAMLVVKNLNERYLWVDFLCIVQDDAETKHQGIQQMDLIYSHAIATIIALEGSNADAGLSGVRPGTRPPQRIECPQLHERIAGPDQSTIHKLDELAKTNREQHKTYLSSSDVAATLADFTELRGSLGDEDTINDLVPAEADAIHLSSGMVAHPPSLKHMLSMSVWNTRGWTLQERLLSRRCLYFSFE